MALVVRRLTPATREDFQRLHSEACGAGWCCCVAWWVPTREGWSDRTAAENRRLRNALFDRGELDIVLLYGAAGFEVVREDDGARVVSRAL